MKRFGLIFIVVLLTYIFTLSQNFVLICAGIALFLFGMFCLEEGFHAFAGGFLERILHTMTNTVFKSLLFGVLSTSIMQSSSLVSILSISFISAGLISLAQGIGIIFGANLGTTTGAWLIAGLGLKVDIASYAMPLLVFGTLLLFYNENKSKALGYLLMGLGFLFLGIAYMKEGFDAFKAHIDLTQYAMGGMEGVLVFALLGVVATLVMQSSHATLVLIITALYASQVTYENALALAIGSNIGTTITALLGSLSANIEGKKFAVAHLLFNFITALIAIAFIQPFIMLIDKTAQFLGIVPDDYALKLALFHTFFNLLGVVLLFPWTTQLVALLNALFRPYEKALPQKDDVYYLHESALDFPLSAHTVLFKETKHLYQNIAESIAHSLSITKNDITSGMESDEIIALRNKALPFNMDAYYERNIKEIYGKIITFAIMAQGKFSQESMYDLVAIKNANLSLVEAFKAAKHMQKNMLKYLESSNTEIKTEYNHIRKNLISHLRTMQLIFNTNEEDVAILLLSKLHVDTQKYDIASNKALDNLIRSNKINYAMATSLMNDTSYAYTIASELSKAAQLLFVHEKKGVQEGREALILTETEADVLAHENEPRSHG
ncbi:Na/Pi cotransporter family protein [Sulfurospirillum barnesii]|uniref:Na+/phosphate symporter n=1 Tax=Sulfurospirillum barnesii (strain ATCC 700032 / DSM 10660 / SES-3) TaxID=760154 RepID=I3XZA1_SULBS|nr:Na/Pi symporter [Sulfurospirillum barnesii]AFL69275.1 Na+/phosphate symporter [Sulfurospirillum barnesii SES-3]